MQEGIEGDLVLHSRQLSINQTCWGVNNPLTIHLFICIKIVQNNQVTSEYKWQQDVANHNRGLDVDCLTDWYWVSQLATSPGVFIGSFVSKGIQRSCDATRSTTGTPQYPNTIFFTRPFHNCKWTFFSHFNCCHIRWNGLCARLC